MKGWAGKENRNHRTPTGVLLGYQKRWIEDQTSVKFMEKGRRIGLSWAEAAEDSLLAASKNGIDVFYIGYNKDMAQEFIEDCADWARFYNQASGKIEEFIWDDEGAENKSIQAFRIRFPSGFKVVALSSRPANLRGKQGKIVIDEAAFHDDLPGLLKAAIAMLIWGGRVVVISTHNGDMHPFNQAIQDIRAGKRPYSVHRVTFDDALKDGLYKRVCLRRGIEHTEEGEAAWREEVISFYRDDADEELFCIPSEGSGIYLSRVLIEKCMSPDIPIIRYEQTSDFAKWPDAVRWAEVDAFCKEQLKPLLDLLDPKRATAIGEDFARTGNLTVMMPLVEGRDVIFRAPFVVELWNMPFRQQEQILYFICDRLPRFKAGALDARGNGQYLAERAMQKYGEDRIAQVMLSDAWYRENMPPYKAAFEDGTILLPRDADTIDDHTALRMIKGVAKLPDKTNKGQDGKDRHGDSAIAGAMAWYAFHKMEGGGPVEYETIKKRRFTKKGTW